VKRAIFHPEASQEYLAALEYHAGLMPELGEHFDTEIQGLVAEISRDPQRFFRFHPPVQRALSRKFPYSVVYLDEPD